jgi:hypothetical protein
MSGLEMTPARRKREEKRRRADEARWAAKSGPVKSFFVDPTALDGAKDERADV